MICSVITILVISPTLFTKYFNDIIDSNVNLALNYRPLIALVLLSASQTFAKGDFVPLTTPLVYTTRERTVLSAKEVAEVSLIARSLVKLQLAEISAHAGSGKGIFGVDQIFWQTEKSQAVFLKIDVSPPKAYRNKFVTTDEGFLYHASTPEGLDFALYFYNFDPSGARETMSEILRALDGPKNIAGLGPTNWQRAVREILPCAHASDAAHMTSGTTKAQTSLEPDMSHTTPPATVIQYIAKCSAGLVGGAYDSTVGLALKVGEGAIKVVAATGNAVLHPISTWNAVVNGFKSFVSVVAQSFGLIKYDLGFGRTEDKLEGIQKGLGVASTTRHTTSVKLAPSATSANSAYAKLSSTEKAKFICSLVAKVGIAGATWFFAPANAVGLGNRVSVFMNTGAQLATLEAGRQLFMEVNYAKLSERLGRRKVGVSEAQKKLSEEWARQNPAEAASILTEYQKPSAQL